MHVPYRDGADLAGLPLGMESTWCPIELTPDLPFATIALAFP
jgi:hypothetical protein